MKLDTKIETGMVVWLQRREDSLIIEKLWHVVEVGLPNEHGYNLNIRIKNPFGEEMVVSGVSSWDYGDFPRVAILPKKQPEILSTRKNLKAIVIGSCDFAYSVICENCHSLVGTRTTMVESAGLRIEMDSNGKAEHFAEDQPGVEESGRDLYCKCEANPDLENIEVEAYT